MRFLDRRTYWNGPCGGRINRTDEATKRKSFSRSQHRPMKIRLTAEPKLLSARKAIAAMFAFRNTI